MGILPPLPVVFEVCTVSNKILKYQIQNMMHLHITFQKMFPRMVMNSIPRTNLKKKKNVPISNQERRYTDSTPQL